MQIIAATKSTFKSKLKLHLEVKKAENGFHFVAKKDVPQLPQHPLSVFRDFFSSTTTQNGTEGHSCQYFLQ